MRKLLLAVLFLPVFGWAAENIASVEAGTNSVILRFPLYDAAAPKSCATDITSSTSNLEVNVSTDVSDGYVDTFTQAAGTLEAITTIGTYATPTADHARLEIIASGSCWYELQLPDAIFDTSNASQVNIEITDGGTQILDANYWVDMTPVSVDTLVAQLLGADCSSYNSDNEVGYQICTTLDAVLTDTNTTLDGKITTVQTNVGYGVLTTGTADSGTTTTITDSALSEADDYWNGAKVVVEFSGGSQSRCVTDFGSSVVTVDDAFASAVGTEDYALVADGGCASYARLGAPAGASVSADISTVDTVVDGIDTNVDSVLDDTGTSGVVLANNAITAAKIAADAIGASEIAAAAITDTEFTATGSGLSALNDPSASDIATAVGNLTVEDQGSTYDLKCALATILAYAAGEWSLSGSTATYQDASGTENRIVGSISSTTRGTITITCP